MMNCILTYLKRITFWAAVGLIPFLSAINLSAAATDCGANCGVEWQKCPEGTRTDISAECLK